MARRISFFSYSEWDSDRGCMAFIALVDGARVRCLIRAEALVELAQEKAASPIRTFLESREVVQEIARELILRGRLDGSELVIRLSDVLEHRSRLALRETPPEPLAAPPVVRGPVVDGRAMSMSEGSREAVWNSICERQRLACERVVQRAPADLAERVRQEAEKFEGQPLPQSAHAFNLVRLQAHEMTTNWMADLTGIRIPEDELPLLASAN